MKYLFMKPVTPQVAAANATEAVSPTAAAAATVGNNSSGRYSMSTSSDSSACTKGLSWSSNTRMMS